MEHQQAKQLEAVVRGRVQGVSFRYYTRREAHRLGITGWVANLPDGSVKVVAQGPEQALNQMVAFLHRGPSAAQVTSVDVDWTDATVIFRRFSIEQL